MIQGHLRSASPSEMPCTSSTAGSLSETGETSKAESRWQPCTPEQWLKDSSGHLESSHDRGLTNLPNEMVVRILSNLDIKTLYACRHVNSSWKALIDENHLPARSFSRGLHYRPIPQAVKDYHSLTRSWLTGFGGNGEKLAGELDKHLEDKHFPRMLFFAIAKVLAGAQLFTCKNVYAAEHDDWVNNASISPDGHQLVTASNDNTAKIWKFVDDQWQEKATIPHDHPVNNASISPDGHQLVIASQDNTAKILRFVDGQWQKTDTFRHYSWMYNVSFSPDGHQLVTASSLKTATIWELVGDQWQEKNTIKHGNRVKSASFSPDGHELVTASLDGTAKIWELVHDQWQEKNTIQHDKPLKIARFSPDGHQLVTVSTDNTVITWGLVNSQWQKKTTIQHDQVIDASFSPDGHHLVTASTDNTVKIWEPVDGVTAQNLLANRENTPLQPSKTRAEKTENVDLPVKKEQLPDSQWKKKATIHHDNWVNSVSFSPDGRHLVIASASTVKIWLLKSRGEDQPGVITHTVHPEPVEGSGQRASASSARTGVGENKGVI